ncbi:MAG: protein-glutamate O-methyltransferase CheR [Bryobacteraceae bacterium]
MSTDILTSKRGSAGSAPAAPAAGSAVAARPRETSRASIDAQDYKYLQDYVYRESGIVLDADKQYLLEARLLPIVRREGLGTIADLCGLLRGIQGQKLRRDVVEAMTTNETLFFREPAQYEALRTTIIPKLVETRGATRRLNFWSAAASSGQEAYSLAIMVLEMGLRDWNIQILGTDLNEKVLERARDGRYLQIEVNRGLPIAHLLKYFHRQGLDWQIRDEVRRMVHWQRFDLRQSMMHKGPFDVVFCRNVLIYFDTETKKKILSNIRAALGKGGYLLLGGAETALHLDGQFQRIEVGGAVLYQVN